jgi:hypothetical protein
MSGHDLQPPSPDDLSGTDRFSSVDDIERFEDSYRAVSKAAVVAVALSILGLFGVWLKSLLVMALIGLFFSLAARRNIIRYPAELTGKGLARVGIFLSCLGFFGGLSWHVYDYMTEVPEGFMRVGFFQLQPDPRKSRNPIPSFAIDLNGVEIFTKGYVHPGVSTFGDVKSFVLVPDMKTCCFGGQPKLTDMIEVTLEDPLRVQYSIKKRKLWGKFTLTEMHHAAVGLLKDGKQFQGGYYKLHAVGLK